MSAPVHVGARLEALARLADVRSEVRAARVTLADAARDLERAMRAAHDAGATDDAIARASGMPATLVHDIVSR
jgi:acyl dehydratase